MALKADYLAEHSNVSQEYKGALSLQVSKTIESSIPYIDALYQYDREHLRQQLINSGRSESAFAALDKEAIYSIINTMRDTFAESKDVLAAINKGAQQGQQDFYRKQFDEKYIDMFRYGFSSGHFWDRLYEPQTMYGNVHTSIMEQIINSFTDLFGKDFAYWMDSYV